jgi:hypothetical protein
MFNYFEKSFVSTMGPNGVHSRRFTENIKNGKGRYTIVTNDNGRIRRKSKKIGRKSRKNIKR